MVVKTTLAGFCAVIFANKKAATALALPSESGPASHGRVTGQALHWEYKKLGICNRDRNAHIFD